MHSRKGFTLIEMLIVIVIIGILAAALIPRLQNLQASARDTKRIADVTQVATALSAYYLDFGQYPTERTANVDDEINLVPIYLTSIPRDPFANYLLEDFYEFFAEPGEYVYMPDNNNTPGAFLIMAKMETPLRANFHLSGPFDGLLLNPDNTDWDLLESMICPTALTKVSPGEAQESNPCEYEDDSKLRYVAIRRN